MFVVLRFSFLFKGLLWFVCLNLQLFNTIKVVFEKVLAGIQIPEGGKCGTVYTYTTLSPLKCLCVTIGCDDSHFNILLIVKDKPTDHSFWRERKPEWDPSQGPASAHKGLLICSLLLFMAVSHPSSLVAQSVFSDTPQGSAHLRVGFQDIFPGLRPRSCLSGCVLFSVL